MTQKIKMFLAALGVVSLMLSVPTIALALTPSVTFADVNNSTNDPCHPEAWSPPGAALTQKQLTSCEACNKNLGTTDKALNSQASICLKNNTIVNDLNIFVNALAGLVGVVCVAMIIVGGIQYSMARNNPQAISSARGRIVNAAIALVAFIFIWAFLQYIIPGGTF